MHAALGNQTGFPIWRACCMGVVLSRLVGSGIAAAQIGGPHVESSPQDALSEAQVPAQPEMQGGEWAVLPIPQSNPTIGTGLQLMVARFFKMDANSKSSVLGIGGAAYDRGTWGGGAGGAVSFDEDRWKVSGLVGYFDARYDFFGVGSSAGEEGRTTPISQKVAAIGAKALRRVSGALYAGAGYFYTRSRIGLDTAGEVPPEIGDLVARAAEIVDTGPLLTVSYDTRDASFGPRRGIYATVTAAFPTEDLGSDFTYQRYTAAVTSYLPVADEQTLALSLSLCKATDGAPFYSLCMYGAGGYPRGYVAGQFRDQAMYVAQAEWRMQLATRWGAVVFAALGQVGPEVSELGDLLPAGGFGVRYLVAPEHRVNLAADLGFDKNGDAAFYLRVGEAF